MSVIPAPLLALIAVLVVAVGVAAYAILRDRERRNLMSRAGIQFADESVLLKPDEETLGGRIAKWLVSKAPDSLSQTYATEKLLHAGFESAAAPVVYATIRLICGIGIPLLALLFLPRKSTLIFAAG